MNNALFPQRDFDGERRRALAKVYRLLLRLAEEAENQKPATEMVREEETLLVEPTPIQLELLI